MNGSDGPLSKSVRITADLSPKFATESTQIFTKIYFIEPLIGQKYNVYTLIKRRFKNNITIYCPLSVKIAATTF